MSEQGGGGRYNRSASGLIGSMIVIVLVVIGFVIFRDVFSKDVDQGAPDAVDYLETVEQYQAGGLTVVYPETLPDGWIATRAEAEPVERPGDQPAVEAEVPLNRAARRGKARAQNPGPAGERDFGPRARSAQGRRFNPIRRTG